MSDKKPRDPFTKLIRFNENVWTALSQAAAYDDRNVTSMLNILLTHQLGLATATTPPLRLPNKSASQNNLLLTDRVPDPLA